MLTTRMLRIILSPSASLRVINLPKYNSPLGEKPRDIILGEFHQIHEEVLILGVSFEIKHYISHMHVHSSYVICLYMIVDQSKPD